MRFREMFAQAFASLGKWRGVLVIAFGALSFVGLMGVLSGCATRPGPLYPQAAPNLFITATFGPDGRLWRLVPTGGGIYVDYSSDFGVTFSKPVAVNERPQRVKVVAEDRPVLVVDKLGRIFVVYYADDPHPVATYYSYSLDDGQHFNTPRLLSDQRPEVEHSMDMLVSDPAGRLYLFWYENRGKNRWAEEQGASLYYTSMDQPEQLTITNHKIKDAMCECCRLAVDFDTDSLPVLFARFIFPNSIRDHGMLKMTPDGTPGSSWRVTYDDWQLEACPEHGPALSIAGDGRYHITWFTLGQREQGLFYAYSDDQGKHFSPPMPFGAKQSLAQHADVLALDRRVVLVWKEFDGEKTRTMAMQSHDRSSTWSSASVIAESESDSDYPFLMTDGKAIFLSWNTQDHGYRLIPIE